jgi:hypothetical protein
MGASFTGQNRVRCPDSDRVCEACVFVMAGKPPDTLRMYTHLVDGDTWRQVNKGQKPEIRDFLRKPHASTWFAGIADSGQKHIVPWCPLNAPGQRGGSVLFEEQIVTLPSTNAGWQIVDDLTALLTAGATKEETITGQYGSRAWSLCADTLRAFEARHGGLRGGAWFDLAVWLAQRDEAMVQARMYAEKEAKSEAKRRAKGTIAKPDRGGAPRRARRVPQDAGVQRAQALGSDPGPDASGRAASVDTGGVGDDAHADAATVVAHGEQFTLVS